MPYRVGGKGTSGCSGFPVVDEKGKVVGCHPTKSKAVNHLQALYANVPDAKKDYSVDANVISESPVSENPSNNINRAVGMRKPNYLTASRKAKKKKTNKAEMADLYVMLSEEEKAFTDALNEIANKFGKLKEDGGIWIGYVPAVANEDAYMGVMCKNCVFFQGNNICGIVEQKVEDAGICRLAAIPDELITPEESDGTYDGCGCMTCMSLNCECQYCPVCNEDNQMSEQDMEEEIMSEKLDNCCPEELEKQAPCWDGYVQRGMKPGDNGRMVPNCVPAEKADDLYEDSDDVVYETDSVSKADGYSPPAGARAAARKAIKFKEDGKANGAGTSVGWTRAGQLARGETLSLSTVKRMYSYFSRHEVDKKGKDWANQSNPSNGYIMWLAWGGDAGFAWSRRIVNAEKDKSLFADFGKQISNHSQRLDTIFRG
jgi:hypothetical protein